jgi:hypothetical protein
MSGDALRQGGPPPAPTLWQPHSALSTQHFKTLPILPKYGILRDVLPALCGWRKLARPLTVRVVGQRRWLPWRGEERRKII